MTASERIITDVEQRVAAQLAEKIHSANEEGRPLDVGSQRALTDKLLSDEFIRLDEEAAQNGRRGLEAATEAEIRRTVTNRLSGLDRLQPLIDDPRIINIHINGCDNVWVEFDDGTKTRKPAVADSDEALIRLISQAGRRVGRSEKPWDDASFSLNLQLPSGDRLHAIRGVSGRPVVTIRSHNWAICELKHLVDRDMMDPLIADFLTAAVVARLNLVVAGGTNTGKTTLLRCLLNAVPFDEHLITIEDNLELGVDRYADRHPDQATLEARPANIEGEGAVTIDYLVREALRMNPSRIIVGEVRGGEVTEMLQAMSTGNDGSMCSVHSHSSADTIVKMTQYAMMSGWDEITSKMVIASAVDLIVHIGWVDEARRITSIREVTDQDDRIVATNEIFRPALDGRAVPAPGRPIRDTTLTRLADTSRFNPDRLLQPQGEWS